jgi:DUF4097 and DUF4098 domain-containing protein YvlB
MRRASIVGPIILIAIGVLFLARNLVPDLPVVEFLSSYWPFILVAWGVLRLSEILFWAMSRKPLPVNGVSGGEWVVVIFLCLIGSGAYAAHHSSWFPNGRMRIGGLEMFGEAFDYPLTAQQKTIGKNARIVIESFRGSARISGTDGDEVKVSGRKTIRSLQQQDANSADQASQLEIVTNGDQVIIRTNQDRPGNHRSRISEDLEIMVPKSVASLEAVGRYGDFDISDLAGNVEIISDNAGVRLQNIGGTVRVDTRKSDIVRAVNVKGSVELKGAGTDLELQDIGGPVTIVARYGGTVQLRNLIKPLHYEAENGEFTATAEAIPGQLRMSLSDLNATTVTGPIRLNGRSRDIQINDFTQSVDISVDRGDIELRPGVGALGKIDVRTRSGDIDLSLPDKVKVQLTATTDRGELTNDFNPSLETRNQGKGATLSGTTGDGPRVNLVTGRGSVTIRKASDVTAHAPAPPEPPSRPKAPDSLKPVEQ